jgi:hypothetical protein
MINAYVASGQWFTFRWQAVERCHALGLPLTAITRRTVKVDKRVIHHQWLNKQREENSNAD